MGPKQVTAVEMTLKVNGLIVLRLLMKMAPYWLMKLWPVNWLNNATPMAIPSRLCEG